MKPVPGLKAKGFVPELSLMSHRQEWCHIKPLLRRENIVIFFAHDIDCPFCSRMLSALAEDYQDWRQLKAEVVGVASHTQEELAAFAERNEIPYPLLSDADGQGRGLFDFAQLGPLTPPFVFAVDRYATLFFQDLSDADDAVAQAKDIFDEVEFLESQCPECGVYRQSSEPGTGGSSATG